jgi:hypothetical protein
LRCQKARDAKKVDKMRLPSKTPEQMAREMNDAWKQSVGGGERPPEFKRNRQLANRRPEGGLS